MTPDFQPRLQAARDAARVLRNLATEKKNAVLHLTARLLRERQSEVLTANAEDLADLKDSIHPEHQTSAFHDRLLLNERRVRTMVEGLEQVAMLTDPVGEVADTKTLANALKIRRVRSPLGVIFMIFESRPNVAIEAFSIAFKSGNVIILRGGKESMRTTKVLYEIIREALAKNGVPEACVWGIVDSDRALVHELLQQHAMIDLVVPRGGDALIRYVQKNSQIPIIKNDRGLCHVYVHEDAPLDVAVDIVVNAKTQRPGVCNSMETVLVNEGVKSEFLPALYARLHPLGVKWHACETTIRVLGAQPDVIAATPESWDTEYLDLNMNARVVESLDAALAHIELHGSKHSESIVTLTESAARRFQNEIDAAAVYWNASTRFTDGFEFGLGGELGISTQKLHVRGPVGLRELTSLRWIIDGHGQIRR